VISELNTAAAAAAATVAATGELASNAVWRDELRDQLVTAILPYWSGPMLDPRGGFYGGRGINEELLDHLPRTSVLGTRVLWTFATAARELPDPRWTHATQHAWAWVRNALQDKKFGGVYWSVRRDGSVLEDYKQSYAQGFAIYAAAAAARAGVDDAMEFAQRVYTCLEAAYDPQHGGYFEGCTREWRVRRDARLSAKEPAAAKSMNTMLHVLEAFTELLRAWPDARLRARLVELVSLFIDRIWHAGRRSFGMFFDADWTPLSDAISYGHDIETAWLLRRACEMLPDGSRAAEVDAIAATVARAVLERGVTYDGSILAEGTLTGPTAFERHWWGQAEGMVGFWDAFELTHDADLADAARRCWAYIKAFHVDPAGGDWFKVLDLHGRPIPAYGKAGPWECPYHHARACFEMIARLQQA
jgi:mannobiose 2-epimerase